MRLRYGRTAGMYRRNSGQFPLLSLPFELRDAIYAYYFQPLCRIELALTETREGRSNDAFNTAKTRLGLLGQMPLLMACKQTREEARSTFLSLLPQLYHDGLFAFVIHTPLENVNIRIHLPLLERIRRVELRLDLCTRGWSHLTRRESTNIVNNFYHTAREMGSQLPEVKAHKQGRRNLTRHHQTVLFNNLYDTVRKIGSLLPRKQLRECNITVLYDIDQKAGFGGNFEAFIQGSIIRLLNLCPYPESIQFGVPELAMWTMARDKLHSQTFEDNLNHSYLGYSSSFDHSQYASEKLVSLADEDKPDTDKCTNCGVCEGFQMRFLFMDVSSTGLVRGMSDQKVWCDKFVRP